MASDINHRIKRAQKKHEKYIYVVTFGRVLKIPRKRIGISALGGDAYTKDAYHYLLWCLYTRRF